MNISGMGITHDEYESWNRLRRLFAVHAADSTYDVEDSPRSKIATPVIEKITTFIKTTESPTQEAIEAFGNQIEDERVRWVVKNQLNIALLHTQEAINTPIP